MLRNLMFMSFGSFATVIILIIIGSIIGRTTVEVATPAPVTTPVVNEVAYDAPNGEAMKNALRDAENCADRGYWNGVKIYTDICLSYRPGPKETLKCHELRLAIFVAQKDEQNIEISKNAVAKWTAIVKEKKDE